MQVRDAIIIFFFNSAKWKNCIDYCILKLMIYWLDSYYICYPPAVKMHIGYFTKRNFFTFIIQ